MNQKISVNILLMIAAVALTGVAGYYLATGKAEPVSAPYQQAVTAPLSLPATCKDEPDEAPVITSISPVSGPIGTEVEIKGCNLSGFESDLDVVFERSDGAKIPLYGGTSVYGGKLIRIKVQSYCESGFETGRSSGIEKACTTVKAIPGVYKVYATPWGKKSNEAKFTIIDDATSAEQEN